MKRSASAEWTKGLKDGKGQISTESNVLKQAPYSFITRFEGEVGTNPEELIAAAHAGCFSMAFSAQLEKEGFIPEKISTKATVTLEKSDQGFSIPSIHLTVSGNVPKIDEQTFEKIANSAKINCPVSKLLNAKITLDATLTTN